MGIRISSSDLISNDFGYYGDGSVHSELRLDGRIVAAKIFFEDRLNSRVSIGHRAVYIRIPRILSSSQRFKQIKKMILWAENRLRRSLYSGYRSYSDGDTIQSGKTSFVLRIKYESRVRVSSRLTGSEISVFVPRKMKEEEKNRQIRLHIGRNIGKAKLPEVKSRINCLNRQYFNQKINGIFLKNSQSRWGSCSSKRNINISTRLLFAPEKVQEYVFIHELAHLIEPNHSKRFWLLVSSIMPDYLEKVQWLKDNGHSCDF